MAIDFSLLKTVPAADSHREFSYQAKKAAEGDYITQIWGWDEVLQRKLHEEAWQQKHPSIILYDGKAIGTIYVLETDGFIEIGQFFILPEYQNKGIGSYLLKNILAKADRLPRISKLACLKNTPAISLYRRHGFEIVREQEMFYFMERKPEATSKPERKYQAVIFDLFGTVVDNFTRTENQH